MTPRERIQQAEREISERIGAVLMELAKDIDMVPSSIEIDMLDVTSFSVDGAARRSMLGPVRLRF